ncbi:MAG: hypothetical protein WCJ30_02920 [Deltaproteobacteria bacterium]
MRAGWFPTAIAVLGVAIDAHADDAAAMPVIEIVATPPTVLPAVAIEGAPRGTVASTTPRETSGSGSPDAAPAATGYRFDARTGLLVPSGFAPGRTPPRNRRNDIATSAGAPAHALRMDPVTGLLIPDFLARPARRRRSVASTSTETPTDFHHDRTTGLMVPNTPASPREELPAGVTIDPATGLMVPAAFERTGSRQRGD